MSPISGKLNQLRAQSQQAFGRAHQALDDYADVLGDIETVYETYQRTHRLAGQAGLILNEIDREFQKQTAFHHTDLVLLFLCTALQCLRQYVLTGDRFRFEDDTNDNGTTKKTSSQKGDEFMQDVYNATVGKVAPPTLKEILFQSVPYDAVTKGPHIHESIGISGATHRYRTLGHDPLLGWVFGTANILTNALTKHDFVSYQVSNQTIIRRYPGGTPAMLERAVTYSLDDRKRLACAVGGDGIVNKYIACASNPDPLFQPQEELPPAPPIIPFFQRPITLVYDPSDKVAAQASNVLLSAFNARIEQHAQTCEVSRCTMAEYLTQRSLLEKTVHIVFIGLSKPIKPLSNVMRWDYDRLGMRFGEEGVQFIIDAVPLKNKQIDAFAAFVREHASRLNGRELSSSIESCDSVFLKGMYGDGLNAENVVASLLLSPLVVLGGLADFGLIGTQKAINHTEKNDMLLLQYMLAASFFLDHQIDPYL